MNGRWFPRKEQGTAGRGRIQGERIPVGRVGAVAARMSQDERMGENERERTVESNEFAPGHGWGTGEEELDCQREENTRRLILTPILRTTGTVLP